MQEIPDVHHDLEFHTPFDLAQLKDEITIIELCALHAVAFKAMEAVRSTNRFLTEAEPWKMKGRKVGWRQSIVRTTLSHLCLLALSRPFVALNGHKDI